jgi:hypothetical protein
LRVIADVSFAGGAPLPDVSPHLDQLVELLSARPELEKVAVKAASKAQADGIVRFFMKRGIASERVIAERLLEGEYEPRKPTPKCKTSGQQVLLEVKAMGLSHLSKLVVQKPIPSGTQLGPSRLRGIAESIRASWKTAAGKAALPGLRQSTERWASEEPKNPLAYVALGDVLDAMGDKPGAARAYGTLFDLNTPGGDLDVAAGVRLQQISRDGADWGHAMRAFRQRWQDSKTGQQAKGDVEASRAFAYSALLGKQLGLGGGRHLPGEGDEGMIYEGLEYSAILSQIEAPVFAHVAIRAVSGSHSIEETLLARYCRFPMQGAVLGAVLSWTDPEAELEVDVTAVEKGFTYDSVLTDRTPRATLKWLPLPEDGDAYPIRVSVRAERLGKKGYAFGVLRELKYDGRGRVGIEQKPFVVSLVGERIPVLEEAILQR